MSTQTLGYIGIESQNLTDWQDYCTELLGLMPVAVADPDKAPEELRFRMDDLSWRLAITRGDSEDLSFAGFDMGSQQNLDECLARLARAGVAVTQDQTLAQHRNVQQLFVVLDPDGLQLELYLGKLSAGEEAFLSPQGIKQFVTANQGLGHIVLFTTSMPNKLDFYTELLNFSMSDTISLAGGKLNLKFLHCNARHHTLALVPAPAKKHLNHFMLQVADFNDVGFALDRAQNLDIKVTSTLGCHANDKMVSFYAATPSGFDLEYGYGALEIDSLWQEGFHQATSIWGHKQEQRGGK